MGIYQTRGITTWLKYLLISVKMVLTETGVIKKAAEQTR